MGNKNSGGSPVPSPSSEGSRRSVAAGMRWSAVPHQPGVDGVEAVHWATKFGQLSEELVQQFIARNEASFALTLPMMPHLIQAVHSNEGTLDTSIELYRGDGPVIAFHCGGLSNLVLRILDVDQDGDTVADFLKSFFTPLIETIYQYRGDILTMRDDGFVAHMQPVDDTQHPSYDATMPAHGTYGTRDLGATATAVLRAASACIEIQRHMSELDWLQLVPAHISASISEKDADLRDSHIGLGFGQVSLLQVGDAPEKGHHNPLMKLVVAGQGLVTAFVAKSKTKSGETCCAPQAWNFASEWAIEGAPGTDQSMLAGQQPLSPVGQQPLSPVGSAAAQGFHMLEGLNPAKYTFPCVRDAALARDSRKEQAFRVTEAGYVHRFSNDMVFKKLWNNELKQVTQLCDVTTVKVFCPGLSPSSESAAKFLQELVTGVKRTSLVHEGDLHKITVDDQGTTIILIFGMSPQVHADDAVRAVLAGMDMLDIFQRRESVCKCAITSGRCYLGMMGSTSRMEHTILGETMALAADFLAQAKDNQIVVDQATVGLADDEVLFKPQGTCDGTSILMAPWYTPQCRRNDDIGGMQSDKSCGFPWPALSSLRGGPSKLLEVEGFEDKAHLQSALMKLGAKGGLIVISGSPSSGTHELVEYAVLDRIDRLGALPVFSTQDKRPGLTFRPIVNLLRSMLKSFRLLENGLPKNDLEALESLLTIVDYRRQGAGGALDPHLADVMRDGPRPPDEDAVGEEQTAWYDVHDWDETIQAGYDLVCTLMKRLLKAKPVTCILSKRENTDLLTEPRKSEEAAIWGLTEQLLELTKESMPNPLTVIYVTEHPREHMCPGLTRFLQTDCFIQMTALSESSINSYIGKCLGIAKDKIPEPLADYIGQLAAGQAAYIFETIGCLKDDGIIEVGDDMFGQPELSYDPANLKNIDIALWTTTSMLRATWRTLQCMTPLRRSVVLVAAALEGPFSMADVSASLNSIWAGYTWLDRHRVYVAVLNLLKLKVLEGVKRDKADGSKVDKKMKLYRLNNMLIRRVAQIMTSDSQRIAIKRQVLMNRALAASLPERMVALKQKKAIPHIPWYYKVPENQLDAARRPSNLRSS